MMILGVVVAHPPLLPAKILSNVSSSSPTKFTPFPSPLYFGTSKLKERGSLKASCSNKDNAHDPFDGFSVLSPDIPWDYKDVWSTFAAYFFILHIPLSFGGLSVIAQILDQPDLDPLTMVISTILLQTTESVGAFTLLHYTTKPQYNFSTFVSEMISSKQRSWVKASALGIGFLIGLALLTSTLADRLIGPKDVNNPILKDILLYSPTSKALGFFLYCFIAPVLEESVYRGFLLTSLASKMKWWQAVVISSFAFSIAHLSGDNSLQLFLIGCVLGSVYCWTGNVAAPFAVHSVYNATTLLVTSLS
ncbi:uncharacterized protein M6B38_386945 [Iris pallida]|uniref:CAAX prenyl protease 2/Lysostaphin resistance protein A-like domain-containing protein n=1 Tax=Iris pallida TaxID=29817 RepID=A0AAX6G1J7_IRIPA|nr:uncharacterized protein M6B38_386945 [Iris pallida]